MKARAEFNDPDIDRQRVLELLLEPRIETLKRDGGLEETRFSLFRGRPIEEGLSRSSSAGGSGATRSFGGGGFVRCFGIGALRKSISKGTECAPRMRL